MFDQLYLISEGRAMFAGPATEAVEYFAKIDPAVTKQRGARTHGFFFSFARPI